MDITTFVEETLMGIKNGLERSNIRSKDNYFKMMADDRIDFDISLIVSDKKGTKKSAKLSIASIVSGGAGTSSEGQNEKTSKIRFSIKVGYNGFGSVNHK